MGDVFKNQREAHAWVMNAGNEEERKRKMCMLRDGRLKEFNEMEDGGALEAMTEDLTPREHIEKGWVLNSMGQHHQKGDKTVVVGTVNASMGSWFFPLLVSHHCSFSIMRPFKKKRRQRQQCV